MGGKWARTSVWSNTAVARRRELGQSVALTPAWLLVYHEEQPHAEQGATGEWRDGPAAGMVENIKEAGRKQDDWTTYKGA